MLVLGLNYLILTIKGVIDEEQTNILGTDEDGLNVVSFASGSDNNGEVQPGILAVTTTYYQGCPDGDGGAISYASEVDMTFNSDFDWYFDEDVSNIGQFQNDFQGTATHELGHAHNLGHVIAPTNLMHFETSSGAESATREIDENSEIGASLNFEFSQVRDDCLPRFVVERACLDDERIEIEDIASVVNPVTGGQLFVRLRDLDALSYSLHVYSLNGSEVFFGKLTTRDESVDVSFLTPGLYITMIVIESQVYVKKVIIL